MKTSKKSKPETEDLKVEERNPEKKKVKKEEERKRKEEKERKEEKLATMSLIYHFYKKFWFGLAIFFFLFAAVVAYDVIWRGLEDKPIIFQPASGKILTYDASETCANISVVCEPKPRDVVFTENHYAICTFKISEPTPDSKCFIGSPQCEKILGRYVVSEIGSTRSEGKCNPTQVIRGYGEKPRQPMVGSAGYKKFEFQFACYDKRIEKDFKSSGCSTDQTDEATLFWKAIDVKTRSEANEVKHRINERNYQFILALFALFTIFPATFYLRKLWRDENGGRNDRY